MKLVQIVEFSAKKVKALFLLVLTCSSSHILIIQKDFLGQKCSMEVGVIYESDTRT